MNQQYTYNKGWSQGLEIASDYNNLLWLAWVLEGPIGSLLALQAGLGLYIQVPSGVLTSDLHASLHKIMRAE